MTSLWLLVAIGVWTATGWAVLRLVLGGRALAAYGFSARMGLAIGTGAGAMSIAALWTNLLGFRIGLVPQLVAGGVLIVAALAVAGLRTRDGPPSARPEREPMATLDRALVLAIVAAVVVVGLQAASAPLTQWDPRAIWAFKAKSLHAAGTFLTEDFLDPDRVHPHPRYPLLLPYAEAGLWHWTGRVDERTIKVLSPLLVLALVLVMADVLRESVGRTTALLLTAVMAWCPMLAVHEWGATSGHADVPLAFFHGASTLLVARWLVGGNGRDAALAGLLAAFGIFTKNEGLALWAINVVCVGLIVALARDRRRAIGWLAFFLVPLLVTTPWFLAQLGLPTTSDENYVSRLLAGELQTGLAKLPTILATVAEEMFMRIEHWSVVWIALMLMTLAGLRRLTRPPVALMSLGLVLYLAATVVMYMISPWQKVEQHMAVSLPRVLVHVLPVAVCVIAFQLEASTRKGDRCPKKGTGCFF